MQPPTTFEQHLDGFEPQLKRMARSRACWYAEADDLAQEARLKLWLSFPLYRHDTPFANWAGRVAKNEMSNVLRYDARRTGAYSLGKPCEEQDFVMEKMEAPDVLSAVVDADWWRDRLQSICPDKVAIARLVAQGYEQTEIGERLGITSENVRVRLFRLRKEMQAGNQQAGF